MTTLTALFRSDDYRALAAAVRVGKADTLPSQVLADWLEERGQSQTAAAWRLGLPPQGEFYFRSGYGDGYGYGYGDGDGYGSGDGSGDGYGRDGYGWYGSVDGYGSGSGDGKHARGYEMAATVGRNELMVLPYGWVICGKVAEQIGPFAYRIEKASVVVRTGGTPWDQLADGQGRDGATFRAWGEVTVSNPFLCREWKGKLPAASART